MGGSCKDGKEFQMNTLILWLYLAELLDNLKEVGIFFTFVFGGLFAFFCACFFITEQGDEYKKMFKSYAKKMILPFILCGLLAIFCPTSKFIYMAIGLKTAEFSIEKISETDEIIKVRKLLNLKLDELLQKSQKAE